MEATIAEDVSTGQSDFKMLARSSPAGFAYYASEQRWLPADHLLLLSEKLVDVAAGRIKRLMVFMPPRHGKSELISRYTPAWYLGRFPDRKVMLCSYADTFAATWGRKARDTFSENCPGLFGVNVNRETAGGALWEVAGREGIMVTAGVGGGITGKGANLLIIDDPVKNAVEAASETNQQAQIDWWKSTARTRLAPGASVVLVMTRWHESDLAGQLLKDQMDEGGDEWEVLSLPGLAEGDCSVSYPPSRKIELGPDPLQRKEGAALWPRSMHKDVLVGFGEDDLEQTRRAQGAYWFNAMYQQRPSAAEGNLFKAKDFRYYERSRDGDGLVIMHRDSGPLVFDVAGFGRKFTTVDCAASEKTTADYTVASTWAVTVEKDLLLLDREREQYSGPDVKTLLKRVFYSQQPVLMYIEKGTVSMGIIEELIREGLPIVPITPDADKVTRALPAAARYQEHRVYHPMGPGFEWVKSEWEPELLNFPNASHDDQVDTVAYAGLQLPIFGGAVAQAGAAQARSGSNTLTGGLLTKNL